MLSTTAPAQKPPTRTKRLDKAPPPCYNKTDTKRRGVAQPVERLDWEHAGSGDAPAGKNALRAKSKATKSLAIIEKTPL